MTKIKLITFNIALALFIANIINFVYQLIKITM